MVHCEKSELEKAVGLKGPHENVIPSVMVALTYCKMCLANIQCDSNQAAWNLATWDTA